MAWEAVPTQPLPRGRTSRANTPEVQESTRIPSLPTRGPRLLRDQHRTRAMSFSALAGILREGALQTRYQGCGILGRLPRAEFNSRRRPILVHGWRTGAARGRSLPGEGHTTLYKPAVDRVPTGGNFDRRPGEHAPLARHVATVPADLLGARGGLAHTFALKPTCDDHVSCGLFGRRSLAPPGQLKPAGSPTRRARARAPGLPALPSAGTR